MAISEICCGSYRDALIAQQAGADRIELNCALELGGLTPSIATLKLTKQHTTLGVIAMVRPRGAGFIYTDQEQEVMMQEARDLLEYGADGLAFGFLDPSCKIDAAATKAMTDLIHSYGKEAVFHRAFDQVLDPYEALEELIRCKVDRVLTSGLKNTAMEGIELLAVLQKRYGHQIEILAGSGVNHNNCQKIYDAAKITQFHSSCKEYLVDTSTIANVSYAMLDGEKASSYIGVSLDLAKEFVKAVKQMQ